MSQTLNRKPLAHLPHKVKIRKDAGTLCGINDDTQLSVS